MHGPFPRNYVDHIMEILRTNAKTLKTCSLTCKSMNASSHHMPRQTLYLVCLPVIRIFSGNRWTVLRIWQEWFAPVYPPRLCMSLMGLTKAIIDHNDFESLESMRSRFTPWIPVVWRATFINDLGREVFNIKLHFGSENLGPIRRLMSKTLERRSVR